MQEELQPGAMIVASSQLKVQLAREDAPACFGNLSRLPSLVGFMAWPQFQAPIMDALVASVGGMDNSLCETTADAIVCLVRAPAHMAAVHECEGLFPISECNIENEYRNYWVL